MNYICGHKLRKSSRTCKRCARYIVDGNAYCIIHIRSLGFKNLAICYKADCMNIAQYGPKGTHITRPFACSEHASSFQLSYQEPLELKDNPSKHIQLINYGPVPSESAQVLNISDLGALGDVEFPNAPNFDEYNTELHKPKRNKPSTPQYSVEPRRTGYHYCRAHNCLGRAGSDLYAGYCYTCCRNIIPRHVEVGRYCRKIETVYQKLREHYRRVDLFSDPVPYICVRWNKYSIIVHVSMYQNPIRDTREDSQFYNLVLGPQPLAIVCLNLDNYSYYGELQKGCWKNVEPGGLTLDDENYFDFIRRFEQLLRFMHDSFSDAKALNLRLKKNVHYIAYDD